MSGICVGHHPSLERGALPEEDAAGQDGQALAVTKDDLSIDDDPFNARWVAMGGIICGLIGHPLGIKEHQVRFIASTQ